MRAILSYGFAALLPLLLTLSTPLKAETDIIANGALNFFFPHGAVSLAIGQPVFAYQTNKIYHNHEHQYAPKYKNNHTYQYNERHDHNYPKNASSYFIIIEKPSRYHAEYQEHSKQNYQTRQHHKNEWRSSEYYRNGHRNPSESSRHSYKKSKDYDDYRHEYRH